MEQQNDTQQQVPPVEKKPPVAKITAMPKTVGPKHSRVRMVLLLVVLAVVAGGGYFWWQAGFTFDISRFFAADPAPAYQWVLIPSNTYPDITAKNNNCGDVKQDAWTCSRQSEGMVVRMYGQQQVGDKLGQGWNEKFNEDKSVIIYKRYKNCTKAGSGNAGPGKRVYECKNVGAPEPTPIPPPDYQWVKIGGVPAFQPHMRGPYASFNFKTNWGCENTTMTATCDGSIVGKIAIAEYKATAFVLLEDRGAYFQGHEATLLSPNQLEIVGFAESTCQRPPSETKTRQKLGAGFRSWEAWQCQSAQAVIQIVPTVDAQCNGTDGPCLVSVGEPVTISWTSTNTTDCTEQVNGIGGGITSGTGVGTSGSGSITLTEADNDTVTYTYSCTGPGGTANDSVNVNVRTVAALSCSPQTQSAGSGDLITVTSSGGGQRYSWSAPEGNPSIGQGFQFQTRFIHAGLPETRVFNMTVSNPRENEATCQVSVQCIPPSCAAPPQGCSYENANVCECGTLVCATQTPASRELSCAPASQTVNTDSTATLQVSGGSGIYSWSSPGGQPGISNTSEQYIVSYTTPGGYTVTVNDGQGGFAQCVVSVTSQAVSPTPTPTQIVFATTPPPICISEGQVRPLDGSVCCGGLALECVPDSDRCVCARPSTPTPSVIVPAAEVPTGPGQVTVMALVISAIVSLLYVGYTSTGVFRRREAFDIARENRQHPTFHD